MRLVALALVLASASFAIAGCSAADETTADDSDALTGVTDLSALETELGLVKDVKAAGAAGTWTRPDAKLTAGPCYKQTMAGDFAASYEFRRYTKGAAFFSKLGAAPGEGDKRLVACVDIDVADDPSGDGPATFALSGVALDSAMRYHLGRASGSEGGLGHLWIDFDRGEVEIGEPGHYCGLLGGNAGIDPGLKAFNQATADCKQAGGNDDSCVEKAMAACEKAAGRDIKADTIDRPAFPSIDTSDATYFYDVHPSAFDTKNSAAHVPGGIASMVYRYSFLVGENKNAFTLAGDPVGKFVSFEDTVSDDASTVTQHARFEKLDAHHLLANGVERLAITPKGSDDKVVEKAIVLCTRTVGGDNEPTTSFECRGI
jgi:hypothetical protein